MGAVPFQEAKWARFGNSATPPSPFNFDVHALFFSEDAVGIEAKMHTRLAGRRVNLINQRREFFYATPQEAKKYLLELAGSLLQYDEIPEALEYRQSLTQAKERTP